MKTKTSLLILLIGIFIIATGAINPDKGFFIKAPKGYSFIPPGTMQINGETKTVQAFFISQTEITNGQYLEFLNDLQAKGKTKEYEIAKIDTTLWLKAVDGKFAVYANTYIHKKDHPVVNISREGAKLYCKWLSDKASKSEHSVQFRLPVNAEWEYAALGGFKGSYYPWGSPSTKDKKGNYRAQFKDKGQTTGPIAVKKFRANEWKLYDMSGNVAEMVSDTNLVRGGSWNSSETEIQIQSTAPYSVSPMVGFRPIMTIIGLK
jgi:formylglycine-generating enzyme required for sulfatase activity